MDKIISYLLGWIENFIKNKDAFAKKINEIVIKDNYLMTQYKDGKKSKLKILQFALQNR